MDFHFIAYACDAVISVGYTVLSQKANIRNITQHIARPTSLHPEEHHRTKTTLSYTVPDRKSISELIKNRG